MFDAEYQDARAEIHREPHPDLSGDAELLAEWECELEMLQTDQHGEMVPSWMTRGEAVAEAEDHVQALRERLGR